MPNKDAQPAATRSARMIVQAAAILLVALLPALTHSQTRVPRGRTGLVTDLGQRLPKILGRVMDEATKLPMEGVMVSLKNQTGIVLLQDFSDRSGIVRFSELAVQTYTVEINLEGYHRFSRTYRFLSQGESRTGEFFFLKRLPPGPRDERESQPSVSIEELKIPEKARDEFSKGVEELHGNKEPEKSLHHFQKAVEIYPEYQQAHLQLGVARVQLNDFTAAREPLETAASLNAGDARAHSLLGVVYKQLGETEKMIAALQEAVRIEPKNFGAHAELGQAFFSARRWGEAEEHIQIAHELEKSDPRIHMLVYNLAAVKADLEAAENELKEMLELFPGLSDAPRLRTLLQEVEERRAAEAKAAPSPGR